MKKYLPILKSSFLFHQFDEENIFNIIKCLDGHINTYSKNEIIYNYNTCITYAGIVLEGKVHSVMLNSNDNELIIQHFNAGDLFGAAFACVPGEKSNFQIISQSMCSVLFLKLSNLFQEKAFHCSYASRTTTNLLQEIAHYNIIQSRKVQILSQKHIRERLLLYLSALKKESTSSSKPQTIKLPFNRQGLADFLGVERSALSREMCKMKNEGILDFDRNHITLL